jgi:hypothetical protein
MVTIPRATAHSYGPSLGHAVRKRVRGRLGFLGGPVPSGVCVNLRRSLVLEYGGAGPVSRSGELLRPASKAASTIEVH